mmetsp:Transcript_39507/g.47930  ORF Transcript_39507/g.47930 Transcript_39507/m.47930 type:complete len:82 (+) Transcript_39507:341-586(+)
MSGGLADLKVSSRFRSLASCHLPAVAWHLRFGFTAQGSGTLNLGPLEWPFGHYLTEQEQSLDQTAHVSAGCIVYCSNCYKM